VLCCLLMTTSAFEKLHVSCALLFVNWIIKTVSTIKLFYDAFQINIDYSKVKCTKGATLLQNSDYFIPIPFPFLSSLSVAMRIELMFATRLHYYTIQYKHIFQWMSWCCCHTDCIATMYKFILSTVINSTDHKIKKILQDLQGGPN